MRTARRSLVAVMVLAMSAVAIPAQAGDDSPGLLDSLGKTVDSLTTPIKPQPKAEPVPAPSAVEQAAPKPAAVPAAVKAVGSTVTGVVDSVAGTVRATSLAPILEPVLGLVSPTAVVPATDLPAAGVPSVVAPEQDLAGVIDSLDLLGEVRLVKTAIGLSSLSGDSSEEAMEITVQTSHLPGTSTLPDGGTSLTATWLMLWAGIAAAGALLVRRSRTVH